jgi:type I restriction enzyme S subunit
MARKFQFPPSVNPGIPTEQKPPKGWKLVQYGDVLKVVERPAKLQDEDEYQLVTAKRNREGIIPREKLLGKKILTKNQYYLRSGDFLISRRQIIHGACGIVPESLDGAIVSNEYSTLLPTNDILLEYLSYYSHTTHFQQTCFHSSIGVDVEKMVFKIDDWLHHKMPLPPISEQKKICSILGSVDEAIQATQAVINQTQRVKQGLLQQLLTRGIGHTKFKKTELGKIPEEWECRKLSEISKTYSGGTPSKSKEEYFGGNIPWVKSGELNKGLIFTTEEFISEQGLNNSSAKWVPQNSILIAMYGATAGKVGLLKIRATINQAILAVIPEVEINYLFLYYSLNYKMPNVVKTQTQGSGQPNLNAAIIKGNDIPLPSLYEQQKIAAILSGIDDSIQATQALLDHKLKIKQGLMQDLLSGRVLVKLNEEIIT